MRMGLVTGPLGICGLCDTGIGPKRDGRVTGECEAVGCVGLGNKDEFDGGAGPNTEEV